MSLTTFGLQDLIDSIAANYAAAAGLPADVGVGSQFGPSFRAAALAQLLLQRENLYILSIARLATMQDPLPTGLPNPDVDSFINAFNFYRNGPSAASGYETVSIPSISSTDTIVPVGLVIATQGGPQFTVIAGGTGYNAAANGYVIPAGSLSVSVLIQCTATGSVGSALAGSITQIISGPGGQQPTTTFSATNPAAFTNGLDAEVGQPLKTRFALYMSGGGEGTPNSILDAVAGVQTGITYSYGDYVMGVQSGGIWTFTPNTPSWFTIVANLANQSVAPPQSLLDDIRATLLYAVRSAGIYFAVAAPTLVTVAGAGTVVIAPGYQAATVLNAVQAAYIAFVNAIGLDPYGASTICSIMATYVSLANVPGVSRIDGLTLNGGAVDITAGFGSQLVAGSTAFVAA